MMKMDYQRCSKGVWDTSIPGIKFNSQGVSNYCLMQESLMHQYPRGDKGMQDWIKIVEQMKIAGRGKQYDCIIGISGGTDSCYLLHIAHEYGLRVLAVNLDNGWSSNIAVTNIKNLTSALNYDLETYVVDYEEVKIVLRSYILAGLPWIDGPTDIAIKAALYKTAAREGIRYVLNGADFKTEGKQPLKWTYSDAKQLKYLVRLFSGCKLKHYPSFSLMKLMYWGIVKKIKVIRPLYYLPYEKSKAKELLREKYGWIDYGGHHHENIFTKFVISYWLPVKFGIDKRIISYSAQVVAEEITRDEAIKLLDAPSYDQKTINEDILFLLKKIDMSRHDFDKAFISINKYYYDYPSYYPLILKFAKVGKLISTRIFGFKPGVFESIDQDI